MNALKPILSIILVSVLVSCGGGDDEPKPDPVIPPVATSLIFPENNTECIEGTVISDAESTVTFKWDTADHTDSYVIHLRNLNTGASQNLNANNNELAITILRGVPFAWSVTSKANGTAETATSEEWKFYNAGLANESHPPFPAEVANPKMGSSINPGTISLSWVGNDVDNDIVSYDIYIDEVNPPTTLLGNSTSDSLDYEVVTGTVYYWKIVTKDNAGNTSSSEIFQFKVI